MTRLVLAGIAPRAGEPLALRWLRAAGDHPLRTAAALAALAWTLGRAGAGAGAGDGAAVGDAERSRAGASARSEPELKKRDPPPSF